MAKKAVIIVCWLALWQLASTLIGTSIILAGPIESATALAHDIVTADFWHTVAFTFSRIALGFLISASLALTFAVVSWKLPLIADILNPAVSFIKSVPIVCIIVLLLIWVGSRHVSIIAVALMVFPPLYYGVLEGLRHSAREMTDMLDVFHIGSWRRMRYYYIPLVMPQVSAALRVVIGVAWKSGVAAEVIGIPDGSIGEGIYFSKISLETADLFAWTFVVVALAVACEKIILALVNKAAKHTTSTLRASTAARASARRNLAAQTSSKDICAHNVYLAYDEKNVINNFSHDFPAGSRTCIMGASGIGKTTLLDALCQLLPARSGRIISPEYIARVFQENRLITSLSAWDNVRLVGVETSGTSDWKKELDSLLGTNSALITPAQMSGGMKRKTALVRALAFPSQAVILDEPFTGLDAASKKATIALIKRTLGKRSLIIATHNPADAQTLGASVFSLDTTTNTTS